MADADLALTYRQYWMELRHAPVLTIAALLRAVLGLAFSLLAIRLIGADAFGYFSLVWAFCTAVLFMYTGVNTVLVAHLVEARASGAANAWVTTGLLLTTAMVVLLVMASALAVAQTSLSSPLSLPLLFCPLMLACQVVTLFCCATLEGRGQVAQAAVLPVLGSLGIAGILALSLVTGRPVHDLRSLLELALFAYAVEAAAAVVFACNLGRGLGHLQWSTKTLASLVIGGASTQAANVVAFFLDPLSKSVLAMYLGPASVAVFDLSMKVGWGLHSALSAFSRLFLQIPQADQQRRIALLRQAANLTWAPAALFGAICISVLPPLLSSWLQVDHAQLSLGMAIAVVTCMLMAAVSAAYVSLIGFHDHAFIFRNQMILGIANVAAAPLLVPAIGFAGAFAGSLAGTLVNVWLISRRLRHHMPAFNGLASLARPFIGRLSMAIAVFCLAWLASAQPSMLPWSVAMAVAASALLIREPLTRATWQHFSRR